MGKFRDLLAEYHAAHAPCISGPCQCACGCRTMIGCSNGYFMCSVCSVRNGRGDDDVHYLPSAAVDTSKEK
jgi:hypothetical protein